jgi:hypothetical protein
MLQQQLRREVDYGADVSTGAGLQDAPLRGHDLTLGHVPPRGACGRRVLHVAGARGGWRAGVEGPPIHCVERWREVAVEEVGQPVREVAGQPTASTEAEWRSLVDVRRFCEPRGLFAGDSVDAAEARGSVAKVISEAGKPCHVYGYGLLNCVTL